MSAPLPTRVVVVDDEPLFRDGVRVAVLGAPDLTVVADASDATSAMEVIGREAPDVVVLDLSLPGPDGIDIVQSVLRAYPATRILMMTVHDRRQDVTDAFAAGARGYGLKTDPVEDFLEAVRAVARGEKYVARSLKQAVVPEHRRKGPDGDVLAVLSPRERDVFQLVVRGATNHQIAETLGISPKTVDTHRSRVNDKLSCRAAADLVRFAIVNGLVSPEEARTPDEGDGTAGQNSPAG